MRRIAIAFFKLIELCGRQHYFLATLLALSIELALALPARAELTQAEQATINAAAALIFRLRDVIPADTARYGNKVVDDCLTRASKARPDFMEFVSIATVSRSSKPAQHPGGPNRPTRPATRP